MLWESQEKQAADVEPRWFSFFDFTSFCIRLHWSIAWNSKASVLMFKFAFVIPHNYLQGALFFCL